ncbi:hypothetical protein EMA8858_02241 [Emticicia aquatica]|jgi:hypothetical protein|uniref:TonB-dependent receptor plug domain-containing protein n=1 Tax=Emticicia aquatica TaxID=1681835 RepID=A0ABN8EVY4_9BACT|nr:TonB-dependent receptor [Emticicia aquatica]CAH0996111.1 hypothetical protein EMA8858_02241 [Emticicia aquatica]
MKTGIQFLIILLLSFSAFSQNTSWEISGKVAEKSKIPVPFANVYVNNTSIGTTTNQNGFFSLKIPARFQKIDLIISFVGYETLKKTLIKSDTKTQNLSFTLQNGLELKEVKVIAQHDKEWRKKWKIFNRGLLGESEYFKDCKILNPEVIVLTYDKNKKVVATAREPIIIQNDAFGLKIKFQMDRFESDGEKTYFSGLKYFEKNNPISPIDEKRWEKHKKKSYRDSFRSFLVALKDNKLQESGFAVFKVLAPKQMYFGRTTVEQEIKDGTLKPCEAKEICMFDRETEEFIFYSEYPLMVFVTNRFNPIKIFYDYPYYYSVVNLVNFHASFGENGWLSKPNGILINGYWGREGFANMLPDDYFPEDFHQLDSTLAETNIRTIAAIAPRGFKTDSIPLKEIITQGVVYDSKPVSELKEERKEFAIVSNDINVKISENDYNLSVFDLLRRIPGMVVTNVQGQYTIHFRSTNTNLGGGGGSITPALVLDGTFIDGEETVMNILNSLNVRDIKELGAVKYGNSAAFGSRGANGTIVITTNK